MPRTLFAAEHSFAPRDELLTFEELARVVAVFADLGVTKVRLTGGEPLLRRDLATLVRLVAETPGIEDVALTTNGSLLAAQAEDLRAAGLGRVTVSLDSIDPTVFAAMSDTKIDLDVVLGGIDAAIAAGLSPVKLNTVVQRGVNEAGLMDLVDFARGRGLTLRFIEYMDVGSTNAWSLDDVVPAAQIIDRISRVHPVEAVSPSARGEVARRWRFTDGSGEIGVISSVTAPFCTDCTRARVTATGELFTCLFATTGRDLRAVLRGGGTDADLAGVVAGTWSERSDRYSEVRGGAASATRRAEMSYLGG
jgi:cyclic pyranopterin phosphate synthase